MVDTVVALLLPFVAGAAAVKTALVATAGLFIRPLIAELSRPGCNDGAVAAGGCGTGTDNDAGGGGNAAVPLLVVPFVTGVGVLIGDDEISGVEIGCEDVIGGGADVLKPFASVVGGVDC